MMRRLAGALALTLSTATGSADEASQVTVAFAAEPPQTDRPAPSVASTSTS